ncbi:MAG: peptide chain release factor N(5)-glutamine methyltransferase [Fimbriimonadaceae bacterium]|nr:peptide chain release factor N(5)-glutamine methyltransferase [Fimbriimonadaceae bacterium]
MTRGEWVTRADNALSSHGVSSPRLEAQILLSTAIDESRSRLLASLPAPLNDLTRRAADSLLARRLNNEPLAYILGKREFYGREFQVGPGVLIPRIETETLIDAALQLRWESVLDVGTGSGCIAITLACERPDSRVVAVDIEQQAIDVARENGKLARRVVFLLSDLFEGVKGDSFDLIVSNPPYIGEDEPIPKEVREFEPSAALFADDGGLAMYRRIAVEAPAYLSGSGHLILEIGDSREQDVREIFARHRWNEVEVRPDLDGRPRALVLKR